MLMTAKVDRNADLDLFMTGDLSKINEKLMKLEESDRLYKITGLRCIGTTDGPRWAMSWRLIKMEAY